MTDRRARTPHSDGERAIRELLHELIEQSTSLVQQEIALARLEMEQNLRRIATNAGRIALGLVLLGFVLLLLIAFVIVGLGALLGGRYWLSILIIAGVLLVLGVVLLVRGFGSFGRVAIVPREAIASMRATREWAAAEMTGLRQLLRRTPRVPRLSGGTLRPALAEPTDDGE